MSDKIIALARQYPVIALTGPRQSGKTTLVRKVFPNRAYVNLEDPDTREFAVSDPRRFLESHPEGAILDEVQRVPELFSYIQTRVDASGREGLYILTGSFNFSLMEGISQSLAGRVAILNLLPFSYFDFVKIFFLLFQIKNSSRSHYANAKSNILLNEGGNLMQPPARRHWPAWEGGLFPS
jgi:hypothetical protein